MPKNIPKGSMRVPSLNGSYGLPKGMPSHKTPKTGLSSPTQFGNKGKPVSKGFPGRPAPLD